MNDILFDNNNSKVITKLSKRYFKKNKVRNLAASTIVFITKMKRNLSVSQQQRLNLISTRVRMNLLRLPMIFVQRDMSLILTKATKLAKRLRRRLLILRKSARAIFCLAKGQSKSKTNRRKSQRAISCLASVHRRPMCLIQQMKSAGHGLKPIR